MTPGARLQMAIDILDGLAQTTQPVDRFLKGWFRTRRFAGSGDRRAIGERVFDVMRHRAEYAHRMGEGTARALVLASARNEDLDALCGGGYGPAPLSPDERTALTTPPRPAPRWVSGEYPQWLDGELLRAFGDALPAEMQALIARAPTDIRVNTLKTDRASVQQALAALGLDAAPTPFAPQGLRIAGAAGNLSATPLFESGAFEFQDEAAQLAAGLADVRPGQRVLDLAAGAGGKALAFAAAMANQGQIVACDVRGEALAELGTRATRAGATIITTPPLAHTQPSGLFDRVFVDAPCSGTGTWRRQPELRWRLKPGRLAELTAIQDGLLDQAAGLTAPGGRLIYATCSILPVENQDRIAAFLARNPAFSLVNLGAERQLPGLGTDFHASPASTGTDGFYCAVLQRGERD